MVLLLNYSLQSKNHSPPWGKTLCTDAPPPPLAAKGSQKSDFFFRNQQKNSIFLAFFSGQKKILSLSLPYPPWQNFLPPLLRDQNPFPPPGRWPLIPSPAADPAPTYDLHPWKVRRYKGAEWRSWAALHSTLSHSPRCCGAGYRCHRSSSSCEQWHHSSGGDGVGFPLLGGIVSMVVVVCLHYIEQGSCVVSWRRVQWWIGWARMGSFYPAFWGNSILICWV